MTAGRRQRPHNERNGGGGHGVSDSSESVMPRHNNMDGSGHPIRIVVFLDSLDPSRQEDIKPR
jgi:hypothetical protein